MTKYFERYFTLLKAAPSFEGVTSAAWRDLKPLFSLKEYQANDHFLVAGERATQVGFILKGALREYFVSKEGSGDNKTLLIAGQSTGSVYDLMSGEPSIVSIEFIKPSVVLVADFNDLMSLNRIHRCLEELHHRNIMELFVSKSQREFELLTMDAKSRYERFLATYPEHIKHVPLYHIASYLGITPEALSRLRRSQMSIVQ